MAEPTISTDGRPTPGTQALFRKEERRYAAFFLVEFLTCLLIVAVSIGGFLYGGYQLEHPDPVTRFYIFLPILIVLGAFFLALLGLAFSIRSLFKVVKATVSAITIRACAGRTPCESIGLFYEGVIPFSSFYDPPFHRAWICLSDEAKACFTSLLDFKDYWRGCQRHYITGSYVKTWGIRDIATDCEDNECTAKVILSPSPNKGFAKKAEDLKIEDITETLKLKKTGDYWYLISGKCQQIAVAAKKKAAEYEKEFEKGKIPCKVCGVPILPLTAKKTDGLCWPCRNKSSE